jgi:hypothetical protein
MSPTSFDGRSGFVRGAPPTIVRGLSDLAQDSVQLARGCGWVYIVVVAKGYTAELVVAWSKSEE